MNINKMIVLVVLTIASCKKERIDLEVSNKRFTQVCTDKGKHSAYPIYTTILRGDVHYSGSAYFTQESNYELTANHLQWNKLTGVKLDDNSPPKHAALIAWRYNPTLDAFELAPYFNNDGIVFPLPNEIIAVPINSVIDYNVKYIAGEAIISIRHESNIVRKVLTVPDRKVSYRVGAWFGGTERAPRDICLWFRID
jgi:hypothetical protein